MKLGIKVNYTTGESEHVVARFPDFCDFEKAWQRSVARFEHDLRLSDIGWLAWAALTREKRTRAKFDPDWKLTVDSVEVQDAPAANPSETTQPSG
jgi:hypothetical protein